MEHSHNTCLMSSYTQLHFYIKKWTIYMLLFILFRALLVSVYPNTFDLNVFPF